MLKTQSMTASEASGKVRLPKYLVTGDEPPTEFLYATPLRHGFATAHQSIIQSPAIACHDELKRTYRVA
jgi:hypothetical protein